MPRITLKDLDYNMKSVNHNLKPCGLEVELGERYGYKAVDLRQHGKGAGSGILTTLNTGMSAKEAHLFLKGMSEGLNLVNREPHGDHYGKCKIIKRRKKRGKK